MGGHGHGPPEIKIPSHTIYKWENVPELVKLQKDLGKLGLKDPWARNHVWRFHPGYGTQLQRTLGCLFYGWKLGIPAFLITIAAEKAFGIKYAGHHEHH
ncbi:NADH dehydrogenase [ubiquinone] 1 beta subcomplex subunit 3 [Leptopilina boulardi]|uniref:NADH dehydrogenase [ubiquinone] 1 beta subcomplex subunit 3 n=1 Tax=Leptopilina boulardi TaxID=63433 RepID=UPI0021F68952|nr:NADH dehydrogenase [ubiquinone] 1 beta subcomplex subunit 3 [Leptopilina boulardi]